ncbi:hypothetical protein [Ensifer adhaerens]|uniref:hypothetical protein n=1 Tax=Ensifer adhaerens TaxID=106592 RepID=UPI000DC503A9|nr:hypothetical protein [Ensifer adhaerens]RAR98754.1 hypothetical protein DEU52_1594 [Ensifer adhaerens]
MKFFATAVLLASTVMTAPFANAADAPQGKVLIIMSGAHELELKDGKKYPTGTYLDEVSVPLHALIVAGYTPVFASPNGTPPSIDQWSEKEWFFNGDPKALADDKALLEKQEGFKQKAPTSTREFWYQAVSPRFRTS